MKEDSGDVNTGGQKDTQSAALAASVTIIIFFVVYWAFQIESVYELLSLAYDW